MNLILLVLCVFCYMNWRNCENGYSSKSISGTYVHTYDDFAQYVTIYEDCSVVITDTDGNKDKSKIISTEVPNVYRGTISESDSSGNTEIIYFKKNQLILFKADGSATNYEKFQNKPIIVNSK